MRSMHEAEAGTRAEMPERPPRVGGGTAQSRGDERQTGTARNDNAGTEASLLMEEVLRRELGRKPGALGGVWALQ